MKYVIQDTTLTAIGDAVRAKGGTTDLIPVVDLADAITNLPSGGAELDYKSFGIIQPWNIVRNTSTSSSSLTANPGWATKANQFPQNYNTAVVSALMTNADASYTLSSLGEMVWSQNDTKMKRFVPSVTGDWNKISVSCSGLDKTKWKPTDAPSSLSCYYDKPYGVKGSAFAQRIEHVDTDDIIMSHDSFVHNGGDITINARGQSQPGYKHIIYVFGLQNSAAFSTDLSAYGFRPAGYISLNGASLVASGYCDMHTSSNGFTGGCFILEQIDKNAAESFSIGSWTGTAKPLEIINIGVKPPQSFI